MAINKVVYAGDTLIDLTGDTVTAEMLVSGAKAHDKSGAAITGTNPYEKNATDAEVATQTDLIAQIASALEGKAAGGGSGETDNRAPYQRVESITSDGTSYIITDFVADNASGMELIASFPKMEDRVPMGSRADTGTTRFYIPYPLSTSTVYHGYNSGVSKSCALSVNTQYRLQSNFLNSRSARVHDMDGVLKLDSAISGTLTQQTAPVGIFCYLVGDDMTANSHRAYTFYGARFSQNNDVVREYIPCYRKSDGVIGLYEKFSGSFLANAGAGGFTKGADIDWGV